MMNSIIEKIMSEVGHVNKLLEIGGVNIALYAAFIIFMMTRNFNFVLSFFTSVFIIAFLKMTLQPFNASGHMAMTTIIILWASFLSNEAMIFIGSFFLLFLYGHTIVITNNHTILETIIGFSVSLICFLLFRI